ncbi:MULTISPECIES: ferrochelatase [unclassified Polaribacter]|uniref:ferrochelatase n=1 Tax=unclassified Polaribacter TaxID=196858 RepID=UPI0011BDF3FE|nr:MULTISPECIES: ferrochelatase [unclassified Polaribacter]TXD53629.1 ferrochelatase [Polaribacter sp. IC063]TXD62131.1 ferrochelatase [Polaribacter sp. IC066]
MKGVLLVNLGSPASTSTKDVRKYLDQFLMDERVIDAPYWLRAILVKGIILNTRPKKSAKAYKKIWWDEGSPLIVLSERLLDKVQAKTALPVALAMRYGSPSIKDGLQELNDKGITDVLIVPLYPQHAMATTDTILVLAEELRKEFFPQMKFTDIPAFYHKKEYIKVLGDSIKNSLEGKEWDKILFSYHGIPERHVRKSDITKSHCKPNDSVNFECCKTASPAHEFCYKHQCYETTRQVVEYLGIEPHQYFVSFQSRLAGDPWLQPYTDKMLEKYPNEGVKKLAVVTPAFVSDCLETLEEIAMEGKEEFLKAGGEEFYAIPCINDNDDWVDVLVDWIEA